MDVSDCMLLARLSVLPECVVYPQGTGIPYCCSVLRFLDFRCFLRSDHCRDYGSHGPCQGSSRLVRRWLLFESTSYNAALIFVSLLGDGFSSSRALSLSSSPSPAFLFCPISRGPLPGSPKKKKTWPFGDWRKISAKMTGLTARNSRSWLALNSPLPISRLGFW